MTRLVILHHATLYCVVNASPNRTSQPDTASQDLTVGNDSANHVLTTLQLHLKIEVADKHAAIVAPYMLDIRSSIILTYLLGCLLQYVPLRVQKT
jgi:hypothetical protein